MDLTDEEINVRVAEALGWRAKQWSNGGWYWMDPDGDRHDDPTRGTKEAAFECHGPGYTSSLDACAQFEATLIANGHESAEFDRIISVICMNDWRANKGPSPRSVHASAKQRCLAFLKVKGVL